MSHPDGIDLSCLSLNDILVKRRGLKRRLSAREHLQPFRLAVLGGSTTNEVVDLLELWLLEAGFLPTNYQSEYGRFYVDAAWAADNDASRGNQHHGDRRALDHTGRRIDGGGNRPPERRAD